MFDQAWTKHVVFRACLIRELDPFLGFGFHARRGHDVARFAAAGCRHVARFGAQPSRCPP
eukprot:9881959-Lingulodinium_polyedra.AAC.1